MAVSMACCESCLTLPMLRLLSSKAQERKDFGKPSEPCHVGTHWKALAEHSHMSTHLPGFQSFYRFFASFCICQISHQHNKVNPSNDNSTFVHSIRTQGFLKTI